MNAPTDALRLERLDTVLALAASRLPAERRPMFEGFAREYFRQLDDDDLAERTPEDLSGALLSHWQFGATRTPGAPKVRVLSPTLAEDGWASRHSVIQIVNDDMPFLVDSTTTEINRQGLTLHLIVHPIFAVERDAGGRLASHRARAAKRPTPRANRGCTSRSTGWSMRSSAASWSPGIERVLGDVRAAVEDWKPMLARLQEAIAELDDRAGVAAGSAGRRKPRLPAMAGRRPLHAARLPAPRPRERSTAKTGCGSSPAAASACCARPRPSSRRPASPHCRRRPARWRAHPLPVLVVTKANTRSTVHRPGYTDYVGVKRYDARGEVIGEHRFLGLFTSTAYSARVAETPLLRGKVEAIVERAGLPPGGHLAKALDHILETYPRDELFQISDDELYDTALGILALGDRQRLRLFVRRDPFERFVSCLVYVPRDAYSTDLRVKLQRILMAAFAGTAADFDVLLGDTALARIHFMVRTTPGHIPAFDRKELEAHACRGGAALARPAPRRPRRRRRRGPRHRALQALGRGLPARLPRARARARRGVRRAQDRLALDRLAARARALPAARRRRRRARLQGLPARPAGGAVRHAADARAHGRARARRAACERRDGRRRGVAARLRARGAGRRRHRARDAGAPVRGRLRARLPRRRRERRLQPPGASRRPRRRRDRGAARLRQIPEADRLRALAGDDRGDAGRAPAHRAHAGGLFRLRFDPDKRDEQGATSQVNAHRAGAGEGRQPVRGPRAAPAAGADPGDAAHQLLAHRRRPHGRARAAPQLPLLQVRLGPGAGAARAQAAVRDLRLLAALRGHPPARRQGRARRAALVRPAGGLPHRSARPGEGADGEEHRHRAGGLEGRLRAEEGAAAVATATPT